MTYTNTYARSGLTAIAAVLALSSTPLAAQEVTPQADPVTEPSPTPAPTADPLSPEPASSQPTASEPAASQAEPAAAKPAAKPQAARTPARTAAASRASSQPVRSAAPASEPVAEANAEPALAAPPPVAPIAEPAPPPVAEPAPDYATLTADEALPIAGAAGLGLIVLAGAGLAARRRRRRDEIEHYQANEMYLAEHPAEPVPAASEPAFIRASQPAMAAAAPAAAVRTDVPRTKLPEGFDLSRFGPHTRAAYLGPTPDNPSLSLKYRLRKAAALDQRARRDAESRPQPATIAARPEPARQPAFAANSDGFMLRRAGTSKPARPVFQN